MSEDKRIKQIQKLLDVAEGNLHSARNLILDILGEHQTGKKKADHTKAAEDLSILDEGKIIEGVFDGEQMVAPDGKKYPVPANYASKSKLVEGDVLKLTIAEDGSLIYKQIQPIERKNMVGVLTYENGNYGVLVDGKTYKILFASVTYYKGKPGNKASIIVPEGKDSEWAALESVIHDHGEAEESAQENKKVSEKKVDISEENKEILKEVEEKYSGESKSETNKKEEGKDSEDVEEETKKSKEVSEESTVEDAVEAMKEEAEEEDEEEDTKPKLGVEVGEDEDKALKGHPNIKKGPKSFLNEEEKRPKEAVETNSLGEKTGDEESEEVKELEI